MSETACCAHLHVSYQTETLPNVGTVGWWACDGCPRRFAPISNTVIDGERRQPVDSTPETRAADLVHLPRAGETALEAYLREMRFPQQPEEPAPASWWERLKEWF